jgi:arginase
MATPSELRVISCPFHNGLRNISMGNGARIIAADHRLRTRLETLGWAVSITELPAPDGSIPEIARVMQLIRSLQAEVAKAVADRAFPLVLAGNCNSSLGTVAGIGSQDLGVVWFDAHADFDDPEENTSGFFDVMGLAMLTGRGWRGLRQTIPGHVPVPEHNVLLAAVRDLEPYQATRLDRSSLNVVPRAIDPDRFEAALKGLAGGVSRVYLHIDLDSLDSAVGRANAYAANGGPDLCRLRQCVAKTCDRFRVEAAALTAYDPAFDGEQRILGAARTLIQDLASFLKPGTNPLPSG